MICGTSAANDVCGCKAALGAHIKVGAVACSGQLCAIQNSSSSADVSSMSSDSCTFVRTLAFNFNFSSLQTNKRL